VLSALLCSSSSSLSGFAPVPAEDVVLEISTCEINLAPEVPKVDMLSSCVFPAYFILMLVCVEF